MSKKLVGYAKTSDIMNIEVKYGKQVFKFNLDEELRISEDNLNGEIKTHVRSYAFLSMLHKKLSIQVVEEEKALRILTNQKVNKLMSAGGVNITTAKSQTSTSPQVIAKENTIAKMNELRDYVGVAVNSFSIRKDLLQSLSANTRQEHKNN